MPDWLVTVQIGPGVVANYPGASAYGLTALPGLSIRRANEPERFAAPDDGIGVPILNVSGFHAGPVANLVMPRWSANGDHYGLRSRRTAVEVGAFAEYFANDHLRLRAELRQGVIGHHGLVATLGADAIARQGPFQFSAGPRVNLGTSPFVRAYYDVTPAEALLNGRVHAFSGRGGLTSIGFMTTARYDFAKDWSATLHGGMLRLTGSPAASPIPIVFGSRNQFSAGLTLAHTFHFSGF